MQDLKIILFLNNYAVFSYMIIRYMYVFELNGLKEFHLTCKLRVLKRKCSAGLANQRFTLFRLR